MKIKILIKNEKFKIVDTMTFSCAEELDDSDAVAFVEIIKAYLLTKVSTPDMEFKKGD